MTRVAWLAACALMAQTPDTVKVDSPQVRAVVMTALPHHSIAVPEPQLNRVLIVLNGSGISLERPSGNGGNTALRPGEVRWVPAGEIRAIENVSDQPAQIVDVELKNHPRPFTPSALDPLKTAAQFYSLELENDQVRVLRVRMGPHEKGARHDHQLDHVVVYLTDHAKGPAGTVKLEGPDVHSEENPLDHSVERIAIDLK